MDKYLQDKIVYYLRSYCRGKENCITYKKLSEYMGVKSRALRELVADIVINARAPIASTSDAGYFYAVSEEDYLHVIKELTSRIDKLALRRKGFNKAYTDENKGQQKFEFEEAV